MAEENKTKGFNFSSKFGEYKGEFKKIDWPTSELFKQTVTVIITCVIIAVIIFGMDFGLNWLIGQFTNILA